MKIVLPESKTLTIGDLDLSPLKKFGELITYPLTKPEEVAERIKDADIILCNKIPLNEETLKNSEHVKYIGLFATGYNNIDLNYTNARGITVCNAGNYSTQAVVQHTFALLLNHYGRIKEYDQYVSRGEWKNSEIFCSFAYPMQELFGKTIGIIGFGNIGQEVAKVALAFGMNVLVYSRSMKKTETKIQELFSTQYQDGTRKQIALGTLEDIQQNSNIITLHCPLNQASEKMINYEFLKACQQKPYLINTARGGIIDEAGLLKALEEEWIEGAALDVMTTEPMPEDCRLSGVKNLTITPHVAWAPYETRLRLFHIVMDNLEGYLNGSPKNVVTK